MFRKLRGCLVGAVLVLAACASSQSQETPPPPLTLSAPPTSQFSGTCDITPELEAWLQTTTFMRDDFLQLLDSAANKHRSDAYMDVMTMVDTRDKVSGMTVPDCANEAQLLLLDAMNKAIEAFQTFVNGQSVDLNAAVADAKKRIGVVQVIQDELMKRMDDQYQKK